MIPTTEPPVALPRTLPADIDHIARTLAPRSIDREDLCQEMFCHLLTLPAGKPRNFYLRALRNRAFSYWARNLLDAPLLHSGRPLAGSQTTPVGGLRELDGIHRRRRAA